MFLPIGKSILSTFEKIILFVKPWLYPGNGPLTSSSSELSERICICPKKKFFKKSSFNAPWYFYGVLAATNLSKISSCSSSITKIALWGIPIYRTIIPVITACISPGNQSIDQFWSSDTLGSHFYNLKYSNHHRIDRNIWENSREIWWWKSILKCQNRLQCIRTSMY